MKKKCLVFVFLLAGFLFAQIVLANPEWVEDEYTGKIFKADGKEWHVGVRKISWFETQDWIAGLGGGWRTPTRAELRSLHNTAGKTSPIGDFFVWAEKNDAWSAWGIDVSSGDERFRSLDVRHWDFRAVAVR